MKLPFSRKKARRPKEPQEITLKVDVDYASSSLGMGISYARIDDDSILFLVGICFIKGFSMIGQFV